MPRRYYGAAAAPEEAVRDGASSEALAGKAKLNTLLEKVKASGFSSMEGIDHIVNGINLRRRDVMLLKTARTWALLATVIAGCAFGSGWTHAPRKIFGERGKDVGGQEAICQDQTML